MKQFRIIGLSCALLVGTVILPLLPQWKATAEDDVYKARFLEMYSELKDSANGYFSADGIPYHTRENLLTEAPDIGHESTSETMSYWVWLEALYGKYTGNWTPFKQTWEYTEKYFIPTSSDQLESSLAKIKTSHPADYAAELDTPEEYPSKLNFDKSVGTDPLHSELYSTYGNYQIYGMHWLIDCDNFFGYGKRDDLTSTPVYVNNFQRGCQESTWETVTHPCWLNKYKKIQELFVAQPDGSSAPAQWRYTNAPDADARQIQATYWAYKWAQEQGVDLSTYAAKAAKLGDYLRYSLFDKHFMKIGSGVVGGSPGSGYDAAHYLISWYYAWGGAIDGSWGWIEGCSHNHQAYQNPLAAYVLSNETAFIPKSSTGKSTWATSMTRQLEFYQWLQSSEGAIAGGATNSVNGRYESASGYSTFYGMAYDWEPVWHDPPSNNWMGYQTWPMQRLAEFYYVTGNTTAKTILDKWVQWAKNNVTITSSGFSLPNKLTWSGQPNTWTGTATTNTNLHCTIASYNQDIGVAGSLADTFLFYAAALKKHSSSEYSTVGYPLVTIAKSLLDIIWTNYRDEYGVAADELKDEYTRYYQQEIYVPTSFGSVTLPNGDVVKNGIKFIDIRSKLKSDANWSKIATYQSSGTVPTFKYHRWWHEIDYTMALGLYSLLGPWTTSTPTATPTVTSTPSATATVAPSATPTPSATASTGKYVVNYTIGNSWSTGATVYVTITNNSTSAISAWSLVWNFSGNQTISNMWNATYTQSGTTVTATNASYNGTIAAGSSVTFGFNINFTGTNAVPGSFTLNGVACTVK